MFRALLWKEWRELWLLPVAAGLLGALSFFVIRIEGRPLEPAMWEVTFSIWLFLAAVYTPAHLYTNDKDIHASQLILSKPLDRFRLWCFKLIIGSTVLAGIGLTLCGVTGVLSVFYEKTAGYESQCKDIVWSAICLSLFLYCLSSLTAAFFKRQVTVIVVTFLTLAFLGMISIPAAIIFERLPHVSRFFSDNGHVVRIRYLMLCPILLFASLAGFVQGDIWRRTRKHVLYVYTTAALIVLVPTAVGGAYLFTGLEKLPDSEHQARASAPGIRVSDISADGNRMLSMVGDGRLLLAIDLARREVFEIDKGVLIPRMAGEKDTLAYWATGMSPSHAILFPLRFVISDFEGIRKKTIYSSRFDFSVGFVSWSLEGRYLGILKSRGEILDRPAFIAISDSTGNVLKKIKLPVLDEEGFSYPIGWDSESRFYFSKHFEKRNVSLTTDWRIRPDNTKLEPVSFLSEHGLMSPAISSNGKWIACSKGLEKDDKQQLWVHDVLGDSTSLISKDFLSRAWSSDGNRLAYLEAADDRAGEDESAEALTDLRLTLYEPDSENKSVILLETIPEDTWVNSWSLSDEHLLLIGNGPKVAYSLSLETRRIIRVSAPAEKWKEVRWIADDNLLWTVKNTLIVTNLDGSNPQEIFRVEDGKFYLYGEEQS